MLACLVAVYSAVEETMDVLTSLLAPRFFRRFKELVEAYWEFKPPDPRDGWSIRDGKSAPESEESRPLREQINHLLPEAEALASELGVPIGGTILPDRISGVHPLDYSFFDAVLEPHVGATVIDRARIGDVIDRCIGTASRARKKAICRLLVPLYWIIDIPALLIRLPFTILRAAGLPPAIEEHIASQIVKVVMAIILSLVAGYLGVRAGLKGVSGPPPQDPVEASGQTP